MEYGPVPTFTGPANRMKAVVVVACAAGPRNATVPVMTMATMPEVRARRDLMAPNGCYIAPLPGCFATLLLHRVRRPGKGASREIQLELSGPPRAGVGMNSRRVARS